jgi:PIN domain nuclease of toxin-antitoxin system
MLRDALSTLSKLDLSRLDGSDVGRISSILRDSARFDTAVTAREARRLAKRGGRYIAARPKQTGLSVGGAALLGLGAYAAYRYLSAPKTEDLDHRPSVTESETI